MAARRGALVVVEGLDRAGKSSQCQLLLENLRSLGHSATYIKFPNRESVIGKMIDGFLRGQTQLDDHAVHLLFSANRWEAAESIREHIAKGATVIVDRYSYSGAVYSAAKENPNLSLDWAWQMEVGLPRPDICLFLNISREEAAQRDGFGLERYETDSMQGRVRDLFESLLALPHNDEICVIDAGRPLDLVSRDILEPVLECIKNVDAIGPLRKFGPWTFVPAGQASS